tara:strand:- start:305 stop:925 length:621 start_codon:yes stop_codon:yes gene_type:complete
MKKIFYTFLIICPLLIIPSCEKDDNQNDTYGSNDNGSNDNGCDEINCAYGDFINCACYCYDGYSGFDCSNIETPSRIRVTRVEISNYDDDTSWDDGILSNSSPDIYFRVKRGSTTLFTSGTVYNASGGTLTYTNGFPFDIDYVSSQHTIDLWDEDDLDDSDWNPLAGNDQMGSYIITPWGGNSFPASVTYSGSSGPQFKFFYDYFW